MPPYEQLAAQICGAIRTFSERPEALNNFESYLSYCFPGWWEKWANTPDGLAAELQHFANMEFS